MLIEINIVIKVMLVRVYMFYMFCFRPNERTLRELQQVSLVMFNTVN